MARNATSVLPNPTSPHNKRSIGTLFSKSFFTSTNAFCWSAVGSYLKSASNITSIGSSLKTGPVTLLRAAYNLINSKEISYIYSFKEELLSEKAQKLVDTYNTISVEKLNKLDNLSDSNRSNKENYISIMTDNLDLLKKELYQ